MTSLKKVKIEIKIQILLYFISKNIKNLILSYLFVILKKISLNRKIS